MALMQCPECKNNISEHARFCPKCGYQTNHNNLVNKRIEVIFIAWILVILIIGFLYVGGGLIHEYMVKRDIQRTSDVIREKERYGELFKKSIKGTLTAGEREEFEQLKKNVDKRGRAGWVIPNK